MKAVPFLSEENMKRFIYADNAATTKLDDDAFESMKPYLINEYGNPSQPYSFSRTCKKALKDSREIIADCINARPEEIYFTSGGTESDNWAIKGSAFFDFSKREILTSAIEHHAVLNACKAVERLDYPVRYLSPDKYGIIVPENLEKNITCRTKLVSVMLANNEIGTIEPIKELALIAHQHGAMFHTDAVQALGHIKIDVQKLGIDMLSASAHKFNGPKGIGFLYIRKKTDISPYSDGGLQEFGMRAGTENVAAIVGMATALKKNCAKIDYNKKKLVYLENLLLDKLCGIEYIRNGYKEHIPGNLSLSFKDSDGEAILHRLDLKGICISTGSACDSVNVQISHVIKAIKVPDEYAHGTIRISLGKNNTESDVIKIAEALCEVINK